MAQPSKDTQILKFAFEKGFRVVNCEPISPYGSIVPTKLTSTGYKCFSLSIPPGIVGNEKRLVRNVTLHRLIAYEKFGEELFKPFTVVRHLDQNCLNNDPSNLVLGTQLDNTLDMNQQLLRETCLKAAKATRLLSDEKLEALRFDYYHKGLTYRQLAAKYGVKYGSVGSLIHRKMITSLREMPIRSLVSQVIRYACTDGSEWKTLEEAETHQNTLSP